jgi:hypothetical protein
MTDSNYVYLVYGPTDFEEGRGSGKVYHAFESENEAWDYAMRQEGVQGRTYDYEAHYKKNGWADWYVKPMVVYKWGTGAVLADELQEKEKILGKLTDREKKILGLNK